MGTVPGLGGGLFVSATAVTLLILWLAGSSPAIAQQSAIFHISDHTLNAGGRSDQGASASSASYHISLETVGDGLVGPGLGSASYHMDSSVVACYPPPGEATGLRFTDKTTPVWNPERWVGLYNLYRDTLAALSGGGFGTCFQLDLPAPTATDSNAVSAGTRAQPLSTSSRNTRMNDFSNSLLIGWKETPQ